MNNLNNIFDVDFIVTSIKAIAIKAGLRTDGVGNLREGFGFTARICTAEQDKVLDIYKETDDYYLIDIYNDIILKDIYVMLFKEGYTLKYSSTGLPAIAKMNDYEMNDYDCKYVIASLSKNNKKVYMLVNFIQDKTNHDK